MPVTPAGRVVGASVIVGGRLVSEKVAFVAPVVLAVTVYGPPAMKLAIPTAPACPEGRMGAVIADAWMLAPVVGAVKMTCPPSTGSPAALAVTETERRAKGVPT